MIVATVKDDQVQLNLKNLSKALDRGVPKALLDVGYEILRLSQMEVPHDTGNLQNSGTVEEVNGNVIVGYHTPYAARMHEHPEYHFQKGRKGKYLEDPIHRNASALGLKITGKMEAEIGSAL